MKRVARWFFGLVVASSFGGCNLDDGRGGFVNNRVASTCVKPQAETNGTKPALALMGTPVESIDAEKLRAACSDATQYVCERRAFRPGLSKGESQESFCLTSEAMGELCHTATYRAFDTSAARDGTNDNLFAEGQSYNYEEANCYHGSLRSSQGFEIRGEAPTLGEALTLANLACRRAVTP